MGNIRISQQSIVEPNAAEYVEIFVDGMIAEGDATVDGVGTAVVRKRSDSNADRRKRLIRGSTRRDCERWHTLPAAVADGMVDEEADGKAA